MPRTPDSFPGIREDEGLRFFDDGYGLPGNEREVRYSDGYFYAIDAYGVFNMRVNVHPHVYSHVGGGTDSFYVVSANSPTQYEDENDGYKVGWRWIDTTDGYEFVLVDSTAGAAVWRNTTAGGTADSLWEDDPTQEGSIRPKNSQSVNLEDGKRVDGADVSLLAQTLINNRVTTATVDQAGGLDIDVHGVTGWIDGYSYDSIADSYGLTLTDNTVNYVYINSSAAITAGTSIPSTNYALISVIETESGSIIDQRDIIPQTRTLHYDVIVALDGSGNYTSPEDAFAAGAKTVFVKNGTYYPTGRWGPPDGGCLVGESKAGVIFDFGGDINNQIHVRATVSDDTFYDGGGTITVTNFSATVTGSGTSFRSAATPAAAGQQLIIRGAAYEIESVDSETQLTLKTAWRGQTESGITFPDYVIQYMLKNVLLQNFSCINMAFNTTYPSIQLNQCFNSLISNIDASESVSTNGRTVELRGCVGCIVEKLTSLSAGATFGIRNSWRCTIANSILTGPQNNGLFFPAQSSGLPNLKHSAINVNIEGGDKNGINLGNEARFCLITGCQIKNCAQSGILWTKTDSEHTIIGNIIRDIGNDGSAYHGIQAGGSAYIKDNIIKDVAYGSGVDITSDGVHVVDNYIHGAGTNGVDIDSGLTEIEISRNHIREADGYGIYLNGTPPNLGWISYNISDGHTEGHINTIPSLSSGTRIRWNDPFDENVARDRLLLDFTPTHYIPDISPPEVDSQEQLGAHLAGIDSYFEGLDSYFANVSHAPTHQHGGSDEVATEIPGAFQIPKAGSDGYLDYGWIPKVSYDRVIYVAKWGNDGYAGSNPDQPKLTLGSAITAANAMSPTITSWVAIEVLDAGDYIETNLAPAAYIYINASSARIQITSDVFITMPAFGDLALRFGTISADAPIVQRSGSNGNLYFCCEEIIAEMPSSTDGVFEFLSSDNAESYIRVDEFSIEEGIGFKVDSAYSKISLFVSVIRINESGPIIVDVTAAARITCDFESITGGEGTCFKCNASGASILAHINYMDVDTAYDISAGTLYMFINYISGTRTVSGSGVVRSTRSGHGELGDHLKDGRDEIDGDQLDINYVPTNYIRDTSPPQVTDVEHLTAHLAGIDGYFGDLDGYFVLGPSSVTDNAIVRFDGTTGKLVQDSLISIDDSGHILRSGSSQDIGTSSNQWRSIYSNTFQSGAGLGYVKVTSSGIQSYLNILNVTGAFGWTAKVTNMLGDAVGNFVGNGASQYMAVRSYYGTGSGSTWSQLHHNGTDGYVSTGSGFLYLNPGDNAIVVPLLSGDPTSPVNGAMWYDTDGYYRGRKNDENFTFAEYKFPPSATDPISPTPVEGDTYFNTDLKMMMQYDGYRSKWLSVETETIQVGRNGSTLSGEYYRGVNGLVLSATRGYPAFYDGTIVSIGYTRDDSDAATFEITADGYGISELASTSTNDIVNTLDDDFSQGEILAVRNKSGGNTTDYVQCWFKLRWRV